MNEEVMRTLFTEAERIANSRPLTLNPSCASPNCNDPLTPSHFLDVRRSVNIPTNAVTRRTSLAEGGGDKVSC